MTKEIEISSQTVNLAPTFEEYVKLKGDEFDKYVNEFRHKMIEILENKIQQVVERHKLWKEDGDGIGFKGDDDLAEFAHHHHHHQLAAEKIISFYGREVEINKALNYIAVPSHYDPRDANKEGKIVRGYPKDLQVCPCVIGKSGAGKTAFMSKTSRRTIQEKS